MEGSVTSRQVDLDGLRVHLVEAGKEGAPVMLLHGGGLDSALLTYRHALSPLSRHHRVLAPDWPGYGGSDKPDIPYSIEYYIEVLDRLLTALKLERSSLVGLSLGGGAALGFSLRWPERVDRLVLIDSYGLGSDVPGGKLSHIFVRLPFISELTWKWLGLSRRLTRWSLESIFHDKRAVTDDLVDEVYQIMKDPSTGSAFRSFQRNELSWEGLRTDYVDRLNDLEVPTLLVHGGHDSLVPVAWAERAHRLIPHSRLHVMPDAGHWPPREQPEEFNRIVTEFLR